MPHYDPGAWNDANGIQYHNNCYDYCRDQQTGNFTQPGEANGWILQDNPYQCAQVSAAAQSDGLRPSDAQSDCDPGCWKVALVIDPDPDDSDFHWLRQDDDGTWSHKPGQTAVRNVDNAGQPIHDPEHADTGAYTEFCGYFCACRQASEESDAVMAQATTGEPIAQLLIYSGRDNPTMLLDRAALDEIAGRLRDLPRSEEAPRGMLGYSGCLVQNPAGGAVPRDVRVFKGAITITDEPGRISVYKDSRGLEGWLLKQFSATPSWELARRRITKTGDPGPAARNAIGLTTEEDATT